jgi:hypothetical protein
MGIPVFFHIGSDVYYRPMEMVGTSLSEPCSLEEVKKVKIKKDMELAAHTISLYHSHTQACKHSLLYIYEQTVLLQF